MEPGELINTLLQAAAPVAALLGGRVYPLRAPQNAPLPYATYQVVSGQGNSTSACDLDDDARVQVSLFAATYPGVCALHTACRAALHLQEVGAALIVFDTYQESFQDNALCFLRTQDYLLSGLAAPELAEAPLPRPPAPSAPLTDPTTGNLQFVLPVGLAFDQVEVANG